MQKLSRKVLEDADRDRWLTRFLGFMAFYLFLLRPLNDLSLNISIVLDVFFAILLVSSPFAIAENNRVRAILVIVSAAAVASIVLSLAIPGYYTTLAREVLAVIYFSILGTLVFRQIISDGEVNLHRIKGAVALYLLLGIIFQMGFTLLEFVIPGSFAFSVAPTGQENLESKLLHLSFVTLTTVGYGDITPVHPLAMTLCDLEALIGQLYPAILIARMVSLEIAARPNRGSPRI